VRFICGTQEPHKKLEARLSEFLGTEDTILYSSCFDANGGLFETLLGEQDAVISSFNQDDQRAATNVLQNRIYANYLLTTSTTAGFTWWNGRTLNTNLQNALLAPGVTKGLKEPRLNRFQFDLIYKF